MLSVFKKPRRKIWMYLSSGKSSPPALDAFEFHPSVRASGAILIVWKSSVFDELKYSKMILLYLLNSAPNMTIPTGSLHVFMDHVHQKGKAHF